MTAANSSANYHLNKRWGSALKGVIMARKAAYTGGAWSIGSCLPHPRPQTALDAAQRAKEVREHYLPYAERQAATGRPWWAGIVEFYRRELAQLDAMIAADASQKRAQRRKVSAA